MQNKERLSLVLKGMAMGTAEVIPGVSGGTIAFITGIYERLLLCIKAVLGPGILQAFREGGVKAAWEKIDGNFLVSLLAGMGIGIVVGVFGVSHLLKHYPQLLWAFFFGLIIASALYVARQVGKWGPREIAALIVAAGLAFFYTIAAPAQGSEALWAVFLSGLVAISALMLPGVSGSFILVLLGMYALIINSVKQVLSAFDTQSILIVGTFALGCLLGLATFSRVLTWTFKHYHNTTMAVLTGFMLGSLNKIWPWRQAVSWRTDSHGEQVAVMERSVWPSQFDGEPMVLFCIALMLAGFALVFLLERLGRKD
jgi:putative membrane protein